jgi:hypothetical protein
MEIERSLMIRASTDGGNCAWYERQPLADGVHDRDGVGVRLAEDGEHDGALVAEPGRSAVVLDGIVDVGDLRQADRRPVAPSDDEIAVAFGAFDLARGREHGVTRLSAQAADRTVGIGRGDSGAHVVERQPARGRCVRVGLDADGVLLLAEDGNLGDAGNLRDLLREDLLGVVVRLRQGHRRRLEDEEQDGRVSRVDLAEAGRSGNFRRQPAQR